MLDLFMSWVLILWWDFIPTAVQQLNFLYCFWRASLCLIISSYIKLCFFIVFPIYAFQIYWQNSFMDQWAKLSSFLEYLLSPLSLNILYILLGKLAFSEALGNTNAKKTVRICLSNPQEQRDKFSLDRPKCHLLQLIIA